MTATATPSASKAPQAHPAVAVGQRLVAVVLAVGGAIGFLAAFTLTVEKIALLKDPSYSPSCSINPVLSCGSVMTTSQAEVFGFPNPLLGIMRLRGRGRARGGAVDRGALAALDVVGP